MGWDFLPNNYADTAALMRKQRGYQSKVAGEQFEQMIEASLVWYQIKGDACIEKTPEPMKPLGKPNKKGQFLACFTKAAQPDYKGTLCGGQAVVFEAKHTDNDRIEYRAVTDDQRDRLELHYKLGAVAFVLVSFGLQDFFRVPWEVWRDMKTKYGRKYIKQTELEPYRVRYISGVLLVLEYITPRKEQIHWVKEL